MIEENPTSETSRLEPLSVLWHVLTLPQTLLVLMGLLALALMLGTLIPQIPPQVTGDPQAWLTVQPDLVSPRNDLIRALGLFDLYRTFWFRTLLGLIGLVLFTWAVESADAVWRGTHRSGWTPDTFAPWARHAARIRLSSRLPSSDTQTRLCDLLTLHRYRWTAVLDAPILNLVAVRRGLALWTWPLTYVALILALIGLAIVGNWGWQKKDWQPVPGDSQAIGRGSPYSVRLDAFSLRLGSDGRLYDYRSNISWLEGSAVLGLDVASVGKPATLQGVAIRQVGYLPILKVRAWDAAGHPLTLQAAGADPESNSELEIRFSSAEAQPHVAIPSRELLLALAFEPLGAKGRPGLYIILVRDGGMERQLLGVLYESGTAYFDDVRVEVDLAYGPVLRMDYRPAMGLVIVSMAIALVALAAGWIASPRLIWIAMEPAGEGSSTLQILALPGTRASLWLSRLASCLQEVLGDET